MIDFFLYDCSFVTKLGIIEHKGLRLIDFWPLLASEIYPDFTPSVLFKVVNDNSQGMCLLTYPQRTILPTLRNMWCAINNTRCVCFYVYMISLATAQMFTLQQRLATLNTCVMICRLYK
jgi:hypothetical protein